MHDRVAGFTQIFDLMRIGFPDVGTDEHEFLDAKMIEGLRDRLCRRQRRATARFLDRFDDRRFVREAVFHRIGGAMKNNQSGVYIGKRFGGFDERVFQLSPGLAPFAGHAQPRDMDTDSRRYILIELPFGEAVARRDDQPDARLDAHSPAAPRL